MTDEETGPESDLDRKGVIYLKLYSEVADQNQNNQF